MLGRTETGRCAASWPGLTIRQSRFAPWSGYGMGGCIITPARTVRKQRIFWNCKSEVERRITLYCHLGLRLGSTVMGLNV